MFSYAQLSIRNHVGEEFVTSIGHSDEFHVNLLFDRSIYRPMCTHMGDYERAYPILNKAFLYPLPICYRLFKSFEITNGVSSQREISYLARRQSPKT